MADPRPARKLPVRPALWKKKTGRRRTLGPPRGGRILEPKVVRELIEKGYTGVEIARKFGVSREAVRKAVALAQREHLAELVMARARSTRLDLPDVSPVRATSPVDIMGEVMSVIEDVRAFRGWLGSEEAKQIPLHRRIEYLRSVWDVKLHWASGFIQVYSKLLDLIAFDTWLRDILDIAEEVSRAMRERLLTIPAMARARGIVSEAGADALQQLLEQTLSELPGAREQIKGRLRDRLYGRALGTTSPSSNGSPPDISSISSPPA